MIGFMIEYVGGYAGAPTGSIIAKPIRVAAAITHTGPPTLLLLLAHFSQQLASRVVQRLVKVGSSLFATDAEDQSDSDSGESDRLAVSQKSTQCKKAAGALIARYVDVQSSAMAKVRTHYIRCYIRHSIWCLHPSSLPVLSIPRPHAHPLFFVFHVRVFHFLCRCSRKHMSF